MILSHTPLRKTPHEPQLGERQQYLLLGLVFAAGFFGYLMVTLGWGTMIPGDLGDARFNSVILEHLYQWVTRSTPKLWSPPFFYPFDGVLAFSDNHFGTVWPYIVARLGGLPREHAFQVWFAIGTCLNFWVCWRVLTRLGYSIAASAAGAFVFTFALPALSQEGHAQLVYRFAIPLAFEAWYRTITTRQFLGLVQTALWVAVQFLCSIYLGIFLVYLLIAFSIVSFLFFTLRYAKHWPLLFTQRQSKKKHASGSRASSQKTIIYIALAMAALALVYFTLRKYQQIAFDYHFVRSMDEIKSMLPRPGSYLLADHTVLSNWLGRYVSDVPMRSEQQMFFGLGTIVVSILGLLGSLWHLCRPTKLSQLSQLTFIAFLTLLFLMGATMMLGTQSFYLELLTVPGISSIRAVSRIVLVMLLPMGLMVAMGVDSLVTAKWAMRPKYLAIFVLFALVTVESMFYQPHHAPILESWGGRLRNLEALIAKELPLAANSILFVNQASQDTFFLTELDAMIYAQDRHLRTLNGYSGNTPPNYTYPDPCLPNDMRVNSFFAFAEPSDTKRQQILDNLRTISPLPCFKPPENKAGTAQK